MRFDLPTLLSRFAPTDRVEGDSAVYLTRVPSVGPKAYLNILFKAAPDPLRERVVSELALPPDLLAFYREWNGARLFFDRLSIYGCLERLHASRSRDDPFGFEPFDLLDVNAELSSALGPANLVCVGAYGYDRSRVCVQRKTQEVVCATGDDFGRVRARWGSLVEWLESEVPRVGRCFDELGQLLVGPEGTLPGTTH